MYYVIHYVIINVYMRVRMLTLTLRFVVINRYILIISAYLATATASSNSIDNNFDTLSPPIVTP